VRFVERRSRKLARESFHGIVVYQAKMERKQGFLFRCVDIVMELFAMAASVSHARALLAERHPDAERAVELGGPLLPQRAAQGAETVCGALEQ
jgi:hypothetical protein